MNIPHQLVLLAGCVDELQQSLVQLKVPHTDVLLILLVHRGLAGVVRDEDLRERRLGFSVKGLGSCEMKICTRDV
jgi:hypothetical protein